MTLRRHNEGSIFQRADGRKVAAVSLPDGRRVTRYCPHRHQPKDKHTMCPESRALLRELLRLRDEGAADGSRQTLGQYLRRWLDDVRPKLAPATWRKHESICRNHIIPALGSRRLSELTTGHVRALLVRDVALDPQSRRHHRATLRRALADAVRDGTLTRNVAALAEPPPLPHRERPILTAEQVRTLIAGTAGHRLSPGVSGPQMPTDRLHALWVLLATTGMREGEALGLTWEDVDLGDLRDPGVRSDGDSLRLGRVREDPALQRARSGAVGASVHVRHTLHRIDGEWQLRAPKTPKSRRTVTLPAVTVEALREHRRRQLAEWLAAGRPGEAGMVFVDPRGRPIHGSKLTALLYPILDRLGLPRVHVHDLRHGFATLMLSEGVEMFTVSRMLGHSSIRITADTYSHAVPHLEVEAAEKMHRAVG